MMKAFTDFIFIPLMGILIGPPVYGQIQRGGLDSIAMAKPTVNRILYRFTDNGIKEIQIRNNKTELARDKSDAALRDIGNTALTAFTGLGTGSTTEGYWNISGTIQCNDTLNDWTVNLFCEGYLHKDRERVRDSDGSFSIGTTKTKVYYWDKNASGLIIEGQDTIGSFLIKMQPLEDSLLKAWSDYLPPQHVTGEDANSDKNLKALWTQHFHNTYGIVGKFRDKDFFIVRRSADYFVWISIDNSLRCKFNSDMDYSGISRKKRIMPYLLINNNVPGQDRRDLFRLAILSSYIGNYIDGFMK